MSIWSYFKVIKISVHAISLFFPENITKAVDPIVELGHRQWTWTHSFTTFFQMQVCWKVEHMPLGWERRRVAERKIIAGLWRGNGRNKAGVRSQYLSWWSKSASKKYIDCLTTIVSCTFLLRSNTQLYLLELLYMHCNSVAKGGNSIARNFHYS